MRATWAKKVPLTGLAIPHKRIGSDWVEKCINEVATTDTSNAGFDAQSAF